jgi:hypothetical protein
VPTQLETFALDVIPLAVLLLRRNGDKGEGGEEQVESQVLHANRILQSVLGYSTATFPTTTFPYILEENTFLELLSSPCPWNNAFHLMVPNAIPTVCRVDCFGFDGATMCCIFSSPSGTAPAQLEMQWVSMFEKSSEVGGKYYGTK